MDTQRAADKGPGDDLHTVQLLQLDGRRRSLSPANMRNETSAECVSSNGHRQVSVKINETLTV